MDKAIPDLKKLIDSVMQAATHRDSLLHGEAHWKCVAWTGLELCRSSPAADRAVVFLFGLLHDSKRLNDGHDPQHGRRAGVFAGQLQSSGFFLSPVQLETLVSACNGHADGYTSTDITIGTCWDADRLNLWRVGAKPDRHFLSTPTAKEPARINDAKAFAGQRMSWESIFLAYQLEMNAKTPRTPR